MNQETKTVRNVLTLEKLRRGDHDDVLACQASNNNLTQPATAFVNINMVCKCLLTAKRRSGEAAPLYFTYFLNAFNKQDVVFEMNAFVSSDAQF